METPASSGTPGFFTGCQAPVAELVRVPTASGGAPRSHGFRERRLAFAPAEPITSMPRISLSRATILAVFIPPAMLFLRRRRSYRFESLPGSRAPPHDWSYMLNISPVPLNRPDRRRLIASACGLMLCLAAAMAGAERTGAAAAKGR